MPEVMHLRDALSPLRAAFPRTGAVRDFAARVLLTLQEHPDTAVGSLARRVVGTSSACDVGRGDRLRVTRAVNKLEDARLIRYAGGRYALTEAGVAIVDALRAGVVPG